VEEEAARDDPWFQEIEETDPHIGAHARERERQIECEHVQALPAEEDEEQRLIRRASYVETLSISYAGAVGGMLMDGDDDWDSLFSDLSHDDDDDDDVPPPLVPRLIQDGEDDDDSTCATSDFLDCLDPSKAECMVGAQTVDEINERFGDRLPKNWFERLSFVIRHACSEPDQGKGEHDGEGGTNKNDFVTMANCQVNEAPMQPVCS
jgi:hypothetical protein